MITNTELAERMKLEILADVAAGKVPVNIAGYAELHDYADANCYGGTEAMFNAAHDAVPDTQQDHTTAWNSFCELVNPAIEAVDEWIKSGGMRVSLAERVSR